MLLPLSLLTLPLLLKSQFRLHVITSKLAFSLLLLLELAQLPQWG